MRLNIILLLGLIGVVVIFLIERFKNTKDKEEIITLIENILNGNVNNFPCYDDSEKSKIAFLIKKIEINNNLIEENAFKEKEGIKYMISNLSHQLKTPLANVKLYEKLLEDETLTHDKRKEFQKKLSKQIEKTEWILGSIIKCARLEEGAIDFDASMSPIRKTIVQAIDAVALKASDKNIEIVANHEIEDIVLYHNKKWTTEVFVNILENAIKYSPENSTIEIDMERLDSYTKISFMDQGLGIKEEEYAKIFQRFYRSKDVENEEGSGIGLYLCRLILEKEKGNIAVRSKYGKGSIFQVYLLNNEPFFD